MIIQYIITEEKQGQKQEMCYVLPVTPKEIVKKKTSGVSGISVLNYGAITSDSSRELEQLELSSFFPAKEYSFTESNLREHQLKLPPVGSDNYKHLLTPVEYIRQFQDLMNNGKTVAIRIDTIVPIWKYFVVKAFHFGAADGSGDINYSLELLEYRTPKKMMNGVEVKERQQKLPTQEIHKVVKGDTLWAIAKRYTGDGNNWHKIAKDNGVDDPKLLQIGKQLVIK